MQGTDTTIVVPTGTAIHELLKTFTPEAWLLLGVACIIGALGGFVAWLVTPAEVRRGFWGTVGTILSGALAAAVMLGVKVPPDILKLVLQSAIAGFAGKTLLETLRAQIIAALNQKKLDRIYDVVAKARKTLKDGPAKMPSQSPELDELAAALTVIEKLAARD